VARFSINIFGSTVAVLVYQKQVVATLATKDMMKDGMTSGINQFGIKAF